MNVTHVIRELHCTVEIIPAMSTLKTWTLVSAETAKYVPLEDQTTESIYFPKLGYYENDNYLFSDKWFSKLITNIKIYNTLLN